MIRSMTSLFIPFLAEMVELSNETDRKIDQILEEWDKSKSYPRKRKKKVRKKLEFIYSILDHGRNLLTYHEADLPVRKRNRYR